MKMIITLFTALISLTQSSCNRDVEIPKTYRFEKMVTVDGLQRTYIVQLPSDYYENTTEKPLVIGLHGAGGSGSQFETNYDFSQKAEQADFIAVYPDGVKKNDGVLKIRTWNAGGCCDYAMNNNIDDVKFIRTIIDDLIANYKVNAKKIYVVGMSNGGMMAYRLAAEMPDKIAAVGIVSATMFCEKNPNQVGEVPILHIHSLLDIKVPFNGGIGIGGVEFPPVEEGINYWLQRDNCNTATITETYENYEKHSWKNSDGTTMVMLYLTNDGGHAWPGSIKHRAIGDAPSIALNANDVIWDFFRQFSLP
ncbi:PHB depolymerase family esterase [Weeksellaceae bacterium A-14]